MKPRLDCRLGEGIVFHQAALSMNSTNQPHSKRKGYAAAVCATAFLFFLVYAAPHRVHHFFDQVRSAAQDHSDRHHGTADHHDKTSKEPSCAFQVSANRCVLGTTGHIQLLTLALIADDIFVSQDSAGQQQSLTDVFQIRAPPIG
jgi:hypothetical protein